MKRLIYFVVATIIMTSCSGGKFTVTGEANGVNVGDSVMVYSYYDKTVKLAAGVVSEDGTFTLSGKVKDPIVGALVVNGKGLISQIFVEKGTTTITKEAGAVKIGGTKFNDAMQRYNDESRVLEIKFGSINHELSAEEIAAQKDAIYKEYVEFIGKTIDANLDNIFGAYLFASEEFSQLSVAEAKQRIDSFSAKLLSLDFMAEAQESIEKMLKTEVGQPYSDITLKTADGEQISISELLADGKYVLLDFWATWCSPCRAEMPHLKAAYDEFKDQGFEIYGVSLDRNIDDWKIYVRNEGLSWSNVINNQEASASEVYAVRTIPTNFLISPDGVIVAKNLRGEEVSTIIGEYVK